MPLHRPTIINLFSWRGIRNLLRRALISSITTLILSNLHNPYYQMPNTRRMSYTSVPETAVDHASFESKWIEAPPQQRQVKKSPGGLNSTFDLLKALLLPIIAIAYLGFCYVVHYCTVPVNTHGIVNTSPSNLGRFPCTIRTI